MLPVVGEEGRSVAQSDSGNGNVGVGKGLALLLPVPAQEASLPGDCRGHWQILQALEESFGFGFLAGPQTGINLRDVDRATDEDVPLFNEVVKEFGPATTAVEMIEDYRSIQEKRGHQRRRLRMALSNRASRSDLICST